MMAQYEWRRYYLIHAAILDSGVKNDSLDAE